ncbi:MAG: chromate efflux transporter [Xanthomonadaceae bacterium]|nr:chromate efflux transporter [Xanthomonadaceae bacterium]
MGEPVIARKVPRREALRYWWRLGWLSFGGPAGQIAMMHTDLVEKRRWLSEGRFLHGLNYTMALPGPEAQQLAIYIGWLLHGTWGGIVAGTLFVLPSLVLMVLAGWAYLAYGELPAVAGVLWGVKPVIVAIIVLAAWRIGRRVLGRPAYGVVAGAAFVAIAIFELPFPLIIGAAATTGAVLARYSPAWIAGVDTAVTDSGADPRGPAVIDDDTPQPARARFSWGRIARLTAIGIGLWFAAMAATVAVFGTDSVQVALGWFFTKVALVTFGGAYAVLPYVFQAAVTEYSWVTTTQMIDGLALGESTPGPLIMVVAFVGYLAGAGEGGTTGAVTAAAVVTFFAFLPSYLFILLGAPLVEAARDLNILRGPMSAVTAAVVGVITHLALFFAGAVFVTPVGIDWAAVVVAVVAFVALLSGRLGIPFAVLLGGAVGLVTHIV